MTPDDVRDLAGRLAAPFDPAEVDWKPQAVKGNRAMAVAYVDARTVMRRLDDVLGLDGWQDEYALLPHGAVLCKLSARVGGAWVTRCDVGSESEQPDEGDRMKAAHSDALKRAAVKFGVGRYLYDLPAQWADYDPLKRGFVNRPELPAWARPAREARPAAAPDAGDFFTAADPILLGRIHSWLHEHDKLWSAVLKWKAIEVPELWQEPADLTQAAAQRSWLSQADAERVWNGITAIPKGKKLPAPAPAG